MFRHSTIRLIVELRREAAPPVNFPFESPVVDSLDLGRQLVTRMVVPGNPTRDRER